MIELLLLPRLLLLLALLLLLRLLLLGHLEPHRLRDLQTLRLLLLRRPGVFIGHQILSVHPIVNISIAL